MLNSSQGLTIFELKLDKVGLYDTFDLDILNFVLPIFAWTANGHFAYTKKPQILIKSQINQNKSENVIQILDHEIVTKKNRGVRTVYWVRN